MTSPPIDRHEQRRLRTHQQLLDAAKRVFSKLGYHEASILDITEEADVSKRTFYLHFTDKEALIDELVQQSIEQVRHQISAQKEKLSDLPSREMHFYTVRTIFDWAENNPALTKIIFGREGSLKLNGLTREYMALAFENDMEEHCEFLTNPPVPPKVLANGIAGLVHQLLCWWIRNPNPYFTPEEMARMSASILYDSITANFEDIEIEGEEIDT
jgi:AcrR family transcriptional regulator